MSSTEFKINCEWIEYLIETFPVAKVDAFLYLKVSCDRKCYYYHTYSYFQVAPDECVSRVAKRARKSESSVDSNYIHKLHEHHEEWFNKTSCTEPILVLDSNDHKINAAKAIDFIIAIKNKII